MTSGYIQKHFEDIKAYANVIEHRLCDEGITKQSLITENEENLAQCVKMGLHHILIDEAYEIKEYLL